MAERKCFGDLLHEARGRLMQAGIGNAGQDAKLLLQEAGEFDAAGLISASKAPVPEEICQYFETMVERRLCGEPVQRILGRWAFYGREFTLGSETLVPRPETEMLVECVLQRHEARNRPVSILDIGTGSGIIAITLACELPEARIMATDVSVSALETAAMNARRLGVEERIRFVHSDLFEHVEGDFDVIASNPPYIPGGDIAGLQKEVRLHDPRLALDGGPDGLSFYRRILKAAPSHLVQNGIVVLELGAGQAERVERIASDAGGRTVGCARDLSGIERVLTAQF